MVKETKITTKSIISTFNDEVKCVGINDLLEKELNGAYLTELELKALRNFDKYRIDQLSKIKDDQEYHNRFSQLRVVAKVVPFELFLTDDYSS